MNARATSSVERLRRMMNGFLRTRSPQERDRTMQIHLAQARGPVQNGDLLRQTTDAILAMKRSQGTDADEGSCTVVNALIETLTETVRVLDEVHAAYAVTGLIASSVHGEPCASEYVDLILHATPEQAAEIGYKLSPRFVSTGNATAPVEEHATGNTARAEARGSGDAGSGARRSTFVDNRTSLEVDLSFVPLTGFLADVIARGTKLRIGSDGPEFNLVTPEDIILMKLDWRKDSRSTKQWDNALGVARVRGARMDWKYLFETARTLGIEDDLIKLRDEAGI